MYRPPCEEDNYRRRWASLFCVLGTTMLLLLASLLIILNLTALAVPPDRSSAASVAILILTILPFLGHAVQLVFASVLVNSFETHSPRHISNCLKWCITSKFLGPTVGLEILILKTWNFDYIMIFLLLGPYLVAIFKVSNVLRRRIIKATESTMESRRRMLLIAGENIVIITTEHETLSGVSGIVPAHLPPITTLELPPTYEQAMSSDSAVSVVPTPTTTPVPKNDYSTHELPPDYSDIVNCHHQI